MFGKENLKKIIESHIICESALEYLLKDAFCKKSKEAIINNLRERLPCINLRFFFLFPNIKK